MYKVQNVTSGNLPVDLEVGAIILTPGQSFDLDTHCSRRWIKNSHILKRLLKTGLRLIHDSEVTILKDPTKPILRNVKGVASVVHKVKKAPKPEIIDLSNEPDPDENNAVVAKVEEKPKKKRKKRTKKVEKKDDPIEQALGSPEESKVEEEKKEEKVEEKKPRRTYTRRSRSSDSGESTKPKRSYTRKSSNTEDTPDE